jgi:hypothetical protein
MKGENIIAESVEKVIYTKWVAGTSAALIYQLINLANKAI